MDRFSREHHELLVRQFLSIRHSSSVADYVEHFAALVDQLIAYEDKSSPMYFTMRFIDGLRENLRAAVLVQRHVNLDTAFVLAQLQDEVAPATTKKEFRKPEYSYQPKWSSGAPLPLPAPPKHDKTPDNFKQADNAGACSSDDRWKALHAHRHAHGLCQFCAEKWSKGHSCADKIQPHAVQEMFELFQLSDDSTPF